MVSSRRRGLAAVLILLPVAAIAATAAAWSPILDGDIAFHWDSRGRVDGTIAALAIFTVSVGLAALAAVVGVVLQLLPRLSAVARRQAALGTGTAAGIAMALWLVPAGLTAAAGSARRADLEGWIALIAALVFYGALIQYVVPVRSESAEPVRTDDETPSRTEHRRP